MSTTEPRTNPSIAYEQPYGDAIFERLRQAKQRYDPDNLFRFNHNVPPAEA